MMWEEEKELWRRQGPGEQMKGGVRREGGVQCVSGNKGGEPR